MHYFIHLLDCMNIIFIFIFELQGTNRQTFFAEPSLTFRYELAHLKSRNCSVHTELYAKL